MMERHLTDAGNSEYASWVGELKRRCQTARLKAATLVNVAMIEFYWSVGKDIACRQYTNTYGSAFFTTLSRDLRKALPDVKGFSAINIRYMYRFYSLYSPKAQNIPQPAEQCGGQEITIPQPAETFGTMTLGQLCSIPWDHHRRIIDKCNGNADKALFYVKKTLDNGWSRSSLLNMLDSGLYEREGKAETNFRAALPPTQSDMAQQLTKDPYIFDFLTLRERFDERELEDALTDNITRFLLELGTGFSFMGRQVKIEVDNNEFFIDMLFYNTRIHAYCVVELKAGTFKPEYLGQLSFYVSAVNHKMKTDADNPTIGLMICKDKNSVVAQYALEAYNQPLGVSEYQLSKLYPADFKSSMPSIEEIEKSLRNDV